MPTDFPSDIPIPPGAKCEESSKIGGTVRVELAVKESPDAALRFYEGQLPAQGWAAGRIGEEMKEDPTEEGFLATKNGHTLAAIVTPSRDGTAGVALVLR